MGGYYDGRPGGGTGFEFSMEYRDVIGLQQKAANYLEQLNIKRKIVVLTKWPLRAVISNPLYGYVKYPIEHIENENKEFNIFVAGTNMSGSIIPLEKKLLANKKITVLKIFRHGLKEIRVYQAL